MIDKIGRIPPLETALKLTLLLILLHGGTLWHVHIFARVLAMAALFFPEAWEKPLLWFSLFLLQASGLWMDYYSLDNHQYLMTYWTFSIFLALAGKAPPTSKTLSAGAPLLVGLTMIFAVFWKAFLSEDFMDGSFMTFTLLTDERFKYFTHFLGKLPKVLLEENYEMVKTLTRGDVTLGNLSHLSLHGSPRVAGLSQILTWWTILIEGSLGVLFLLPLLPRVKALLLLTFILSTYPVASVTGFGQLLSILGLVSLGEDKNLTPYRWGYLSTFFLLEVFTVPFGPILEVFGGS